MIKMRREQLKITQEELAKMAGYKSRTTIAKIETGKIDVPSSQLVSIARALDCSPSWLIGLTDDVNKQETKISSSAPQANPLKLLKIQ